VTHAEARSMYADDVCKKKPDSDKTKENNFIIFSDSLSSLQALNAFKLELYWVAQLK